jgi:hypothetical protein
MHEHYARSFAPYGMLRRIGGLMIKVVLALSAAVFATILGAKLMYDATVHTGTEPAKQPWAQNTMEFMAWNGEKWTAWIRDNKFEHRPQNDTLWSPHANTSLAFIGWEGEPWQVKITSDATTLAHRGDWKGATEQVTAIRYRDWKGEKQLRTLTQLRR